MQFKDSFIIKNYSICTEWSYPKVVASWRMDGNNTNCCVWDGVECNQDTGHVIALNLESNCLYGSITSSSSLLCLLHLQNLTLAYYDFNHSQIPSKIGNLSSLIHLDLSYSKFSGQIPFEIQYLSKSSFLYLVSFDGYNLYTKSLMKSLVQNLTNLEDLRFSDLGSYRLYGRFPTRIFQLPHLLGLSALYNEDLIGHLPKFHTNSPLKYLILGGTNFSGDLPASIGNLNSLNSFKIGNCNFLGTIPNSFSNLTHLIELDLSQNSFDDLSWLTRAKLSHLNLTKFPDILRNQSRLWYLDLKGNNFQGLIPKWMFNVSWEKGMMERGMARLAKKLKRLKSSLRGWNKDVFGATTLNIRLLEDRVEKLEKKMQEGFNEEDEQDYLVAKIELNTWLEREETRLRQQAKLAWLEKGEASASFFRACNARSKRQVNEMRLPDGRWLKTSEEIHEEAVLYFSNLLSHKQVGVLPDLSNLVQTVVTEEDNERLCQLPSIQDVRDVVFSIPVNSSLGLDGFGSGFFQACWHIVGNDVVEWSRQKILISLGQSAYARPSTKFARKFCKESLGRLYLSNNFLSGIENSPTIIPWPKLEDLELKNNMMHGSLPIPPPAIWFYSISNNSFTGRISPFICNMSSPLLLDLSYNHLSCMIHPCIGNLSQSLSVLVLRSNNFSSNIPKTCQNQLQGHLPRSLANCTKHEYLHVGHNQINDTYPFWLGTLQQLNILVFHSNGFHDAIRSPETNYTLPNLHIIDLSDNHLSRNLPPGYFTQWDAMKSVGAKNLKYLDDYSIDCSIIITTKGVELEYKKIQDGLTVIDFSCNRFEEDILERLGNLVGLLVLNLSNNAFTGHIPSSFANLTQLESLDLSQNKLFGEIPPDLTHLNFLSKFNVSHNCLIGLIPHGQQFGTFGNTSFEDNRALCGRPLSKIYGDSDNSMPPPSTNFEENQGPKFFFEFGWKAVVMGYGCGFVFGVVIGHIVITRKQDWVIKIFGKKQHQTRIMVNHRK
ncbi:hypothetical protein I3760_04G192000 [Carya illinoinensis]|nr:hypothetical protein I3760_04G192000 [Carya illinoinensis]